MIDHTDHFVDVDHDDDVTNIHDHHHYCPNLTLLDRLFVVVDGDVVGRIQMILVYLEFQSIVNHYFNEYANYLESNCQRKWELMNQQLHQDFWVADKVKHYLYKTIVPVAISFFTNKNRTW